MRETQQQRYGFRRHTDGTVVGWWNHPGPRDRAVAKTTQDARALGVDLVVDLVTERVTTTTHREVTRRGVRITEEAA